MPDIIDVNTGAIILGEVTIEEVASSMLGTMLDIASGQSLTKAELLRQNDFIPWKRDVWL